MLRELIEDTKEAVGDTCGVVCRISVDELIGPAGLHKDEVGEMVALLRRLSRYVGPDIERMGE